MADEFKTMKSHCNKCGGERTHHVFFHHHKQDTDELWSDGEHIADLFWKMDHYMVQCMGCEEITMRRDFWDDMGEETETTYYPPQASREMPSWMKTDEFSAACPEAIVELLKEAYVCFQNECDRGAAMCIRAIFETAMVDKCGDQGTFAKNLEKFIADGHLLPKQRELMEPVIDAGSATIHRSFKPTRNQLAVILDLTETALATAYYHPARAAKLKAAIPARKKPPGTL